ncbi:MAG: hypothetical protein P9L99_10170 [Candidatus Lernaella stagnicola]|nr:hypothetical protein [Candidatus Lernaella stagnicola]
MTPGATDSSASARISYIDFFKGLACLIMLQSHAMRFHIGDPDCFANLLLAVQPPFAQLFFFASGMNIILVLERYRSRPHFPITAYYLWGAVILFLIGYLYSFARLSLNTWQIFQGIAACIAVAFLMLRTKWPTWVHLLICFGLYLVYFRFRVGLEPVLMWYRNTLPVGVAPDDPAAIIAMKTILTGLSLPQRWLFANFSLLPWVCYTILGGVAFRSVRENPRTAKWWGIGFALCLAGGFGSAYLPLGLQIGALSGDQVTDALFRHVPYHAFSALGISGLAWLACHYGYDRWKRRGKVGRAIAEYIEFLGIFSFVFFCFHWLCLKLMIHAWGLAASWGWLRGEMPIHLRWIVAFALVCPLMVPAARLNIAWGKRKHFVSEAAAFTAGMTVLSIVLLLAKAVRLSNYFAFIACVGAAYLYPALRGLLKQYYQGKQAQQVSAG